MKHYVRNTFFYILFLATMVFVASCSNTKKVLYFNTPYDTSLLSYTLPVDPVVQKNDLLNIQVTSLSTEATAVFNLANSPGGGGSGGTGSASGYLVHTDGYIQMPLLGRVKAAGLTLNQLRADITNLLLQKKILIDPIVSVRFVNLRIFVLGEVSRPGPIPFTTEQMSVIEAVGLAGDLPMTANKHNLLLIREENGRKIFRHLDLTSRDIFSSPYFYLKSNDIIYVEPTQAKVKSSTEPRIPGWVTFAMSTLSFVVGISVLFLRN